jgi:glutaminyl-peptide cyclotransferase
MIATPNIQRPTSNTQFRDHQFSLGSWALDVGCWAFRSLNCRLLCCIAICTPLVSCNPTTDPVAANQPVLLDAAQVDGSRAFEQVKQLVAITPRHSGSDGAAQAANHLRQALAPYTETCKIDAFDDATPIGTLTFRNVVGILPGTSSNIVILASHYDTKSGVGDDFQGANDSGSSTGLLIELARVLHTQPPLPFQVMIAFFDGEECIEAYGTTDGLHGSRQLVQQLKKRNQLPNVEAMILLDMVGDPDLTITLPRNIDRKLMSIAFDAARTAGIRKQFTLSKHNMLDDHVPFLEAGVAVIDIIDFQHGSRHGLNDYWHTTNDTLEHISPDSLQSIGQVVIHMLNAISRR